MVRTARRAILSVCALTAVRRCHLWGGLRCSDILPKGTRRLFCHRCSWLRCRAQTPCTLHRSALTLVRGGGAAGGSPCPVADLSAGLRWPARARSPPLRPASRLLGALAALDFGLQVRIETRPAQRTIFSGPEELPVQELPSELAEMVSELRVRSFALRHELEHVTSALMVNVEYGFWALARRAALDLAGLLGQARKRRLAAPELCYRGAHAARHIADLCQQEVR